jgi:hypothetical protein
MGAWQGWLAAALALAALALAVGVTVASGAKLVPNPANDPGLIDEPIEDYRYDDAERCVKGAQPGARALAHWLDRTVRGELWGIVRCDHLSPGDWSVHAEGRAIDWHLDARERKERRAARSLIRTLIGRDRNGEPAALARRMGVQGLIFNCKSWWSGQEGLGKYSYCYRPSGKKRDGLNPTQAHVDHVHVELNWPGARKRTSFWRSPLAGSRPYPGGPLR